MRFSIVQSTCLLSVLLITGVLGAAEQETKETAIGSVNYQIPADWKVQAPRSMRIAQWALPTAEGDQENPIFYVAQFGGGGGGVEPNIKRWIGQFADGSGLEINNKALEMSEVGTEKYRSAINSPLKVNGIEFYTLDLTGTFNDTIGGPFAGGKPNPKKDNRILAAVVIVPNDPSTYFFKLTGPKASVAAAKEAWHAMLKSAQPAK